MTTIIGNFRPRGIQIQLKDTISNESKSFTIHGISFNKLYYHILFYVQQLTKYKHVKLICKEGTNEKKIEK